LVFICNLGLLIGSLRIEAHLPITLKKINTIYQKLLSFYRFLDIIFFHIANLDSINTL